MKVRLVGAISLKDGSGLAGPEVAANFDSLTLSLGAFGGKGNDDSVISERRVGSPIVRATRRLAF